MTIERVYNVPLRKGFIEAARYKKTKKAVTTLKEFLSRHLRQPDLKKIYIGRKLNEELWKHGIKNPPSMIKVVVIKEDNGDVKAELFGNAYPHKKKEEKAKDAKVDEKTETKEKETKKKSTSQEKKHEHHEHNHESHEGHNHEEKHEHAHGHSHEAPKAPAKKASKKSS